MTNKLLPILALVFAAQVSHLACRSVESADEPAPESIPPTQPAPAAKPALTPGEQAQANTEKTRAANKEAVARLHSEQRKQYAGNPDWLALPGLLADRKARRVIFQAEGTGLSAKSEPPEFFIISESSGHDYEALAISFARPSDVHKALLFIGMEPGRHTNPDKLQFWPKGERVKLFMSYRDGEKTVGPVRMEKLFLERATGRPLAESGLVFTGSAFIDSPAEPGVKAYAADVYDPNAIAANYNEPSAVLDVPRQAPQKAVYNHLAVNPDFQIPDGARIEISLEPEYTDGKKRVLDLQLSVTAPVDGKGTELNNLAFALTDSTGKVLNAGSDLNGVLAVFTALTKDGQDPFVTLNLGDSVALKGIQALASVLAAIDTETGIRVEPPADKQLYYRAFSPDPSFRDRDGRMAQPWELRLTRKDGRTAGVLSEIRQIWKEDQIKPDLKVIERPVTSGNELRQALDGALTREKEINAAIEKAADDEARQKLQAELPTRLRVIIVFAQADVTQKELMDFLIPARTTHPLIHVFVE